MNHMKNILTQVVILPTEDASRVVLDKMDTLFYNKDFSVKSSLAFPQHLYFVSDEEIKNGDWAFCYDVHYSNPLHPKEQYINPIRKYHTGGNCPACKKIEASTDKSLEVLYPPEEFLKLYCEQGGIDKFEIIK